MTLKLIPKEKKLKLIPKQEEYSDIPTLDENEPSNRITRELTGPQKAANYIANILSMGASKPYQESLTPKEKEYEEQSKLWAAAQVPLKMTADVGSLGTAATLSGLDILGLTEGGKAGQLDVPFQQRFQTSPFQLLKKIVPTEKGQKYYEKTTETLGALPATTQFQALSKFSGVKTKPSNLTQKINEEVQSFVNKSATEQLKEFSKSSKLNKTIQESADAGYVFIPSKMKNPSKINQVKESTVGTDRLGEQAREINQKVTDNLVKKYLGLPENTQLDFDVLDRVRKRYGETYAKIDNLEAPPSKTIQYDNVIDFNTGKPLKVKAKKNKNGAQVLAELKQARYDASDTWNFFKRSGNPNVRKQAVELEKKVARLEKELENIAEYNGKQHLIPELKKARQEIAKAHLVQKALNDVTGNVDAKVFSKLAYEKRLVDPNAKKIAKFYQGFGDLAKIPRSVKQTPFTVLDVGIATYGAATGKPSLAVPVIGKRLSISSMAKPSVQKAMVAREVSPPKNIYSLLQIPSLTKFTPSEQKIYRAGLSSLLAPYNEEEQ